MGRTLFFVPMTIDSTIKFSENPSELINLYQKILGSGSECGYTLTFEVLGDLFPKVDENSYDCHSFAFLLLSSLGIQAPPVVEVEKPNLDDYEFSTFYEDELRQRVRSARRTTNGRERSQKQKDFTTWVYNNSSQYLIKRHSLSEYERAEQASRELAGLIVNNEIKGGTLSRYMLISTGEPGNGFYDVHSAILLGENKDRNDLWLIEKDGLGSNPSVSRLSNVISLYNCSLSSRYKNPSINILHSEIQAPNV